MFKGNQGFAKKFSMAATCMLVATMLFQGMALGAESFWDTLNQPKVRKAVPLTNETVANLVEKLKPAVVNISVTEVIKTGSPQGFSAPFEKR